MKVVFVTPRYGVEVLGGAEFAARMLAERVASQLGWDVEVFTSCASDAVTWHNDYAPGTTQINGVSVTRFPTTGPRDPKFDDLSARVHRFPRLAPRKLQEEWVDKQGPHTPALLDALDNSDADVFVFYPYLYYPTVRGLPRVAERSVMHPAAHDEVPIRMPIFGEVFGSAAGFVFQTNGERQLTESLFSIAHKPQLLLGLGVDVGDGDTAAFRTRYGLGDRPYLMCLGRVDNGKGSTVLATYFEQYKRRNPGDLALVFMGTIKDEMPEQPDIVMTGPVDDEAKWAGLRGSEVLVSPSAYEAFSLALVEGWAAGKPALVNGACIATREHVELSRGGLWFENYLSFESALERLTARDETSQAMAAAGKAYVDERFRWPALIERYGEFLQSVATRAKRKAGV